MFRKKHARNLNDALVSEAPFILVILCLLLLAWILHPYPHLAMWLGFGIAGYSAIANDSIQTLGTYLTTHRGTHWLLLWLFVGGILGATHATGWFVDNGDIAFGRLEKIAQPTEFSFLSLSAPVILLILTRLKMPVSTTILLLSAFSSTVVIRSMILKTFYGYMVAFVVGIVVWGVVAYIHKKEFASKKYNKKVWGVLQTLSTSFLWCTWIMHDTANVAVFLPRTLTFNQMVVAVGFLVLLIGLLMYWKGGRIQGVVQEKTDINDIRAATIIDFIYALVLLVFKEWNNIPMSTTWVFLGLLAGREIALMFLSAKEEPYKTTAKMVLWDIGRAGLGLLISLLIVVFIAT